MKFVGLYAKRLCLDTSGLIDRHRWFFYLYLIALFLDMLSTIYFMQFTGPRAETHPVVWAASVQFGTTAGPILGAMFKVFALCIVCSHWKRVTRPVLCIATAVYLFAAWYNVYAQDIYVNYLAIWH